MFSPAKLWKTRWGKAAAVSVVLLLLYTVVGFLVVPWTAKSMLAEKLSQALNRQVSVQRVRTNPYTFFAQVEGLEAKDPDGKTFFSLKSFSVNMGFWSSLFHLAPVVSECLLEDPYVRVVRHADGRFNFSDLTEADDKEEAPPEQKAPEGGDVPAFSLSKFKISGGSIDYQDEKKHFSHDFSRLALDLPFISTMKKESEGESVFSFSGETSAEEVVLSDGALELRPFRVSGTIELKGIPIKKYTPYFADLIRFEIADGSLSVKSSFRFGAIAEDLPEIHDVGLKIDSLRLVSTDKVPFVVIPSLAVKDADVHLKGRRVSVGEISTEQGEVRVLRDENGALNLQNLVAGGGADTKEAPEESETTSEDAWVFELKNGRVGHYAVHVEDRVPADPAVVDLRDLAVEVTDLKTEENAEAKIRVASNINDNGTAEIQGRMTLIPLSLDLSLDVQKVDLPPFQPYLPPNVKVVLKKGYAQTKGEFRLDASGSSDPEISYAGDVSVMDLATVDDVSQSRLIDWDALEFSKMDLNVRPFRLSVKGVGLTGMRCRLIIEKNGAINLAEAFASSPAKDGGEPEEPSPAEKDASNSASVDVGGVTVQNGQIDFSDYSIQPNFNSALQELTGTVSRLHTGQKEPSEILIQGKMGEYAPLEIKGKVNLFSKGLYADVGLNFKNINLDPMDPYSGTYLGYVIKRGRLSLALNYQLVENRLQAKNRIRLDQFELGDNVDSPKATSLPVRFAIALLKDRDGNIDLNIPVAGEVNDPKFDLGEVIVKALTSLVSKLVSAPFAALGAVFAGGEDLSFVVFPYGSAELTLDQEEKLNNLETALYERPELTIEIRGRAVENLDSPALRDNQFEMLLKMEKRKDLQQKGTFAPPLEEIKVLPGERETYIRQAYERSDFPKPKDARGKVVPISFEEIRKLLFTHVEVPRMELTDLADERAENAKKYLLRDGKVSPDRIRVADGQVVAEAEGRDDGLVGVNFELK